MSSQTCPRCGGRKKIECGYCGNNTSRRISCSYCGKSGKMTCPTCNGRGTVSAPPRKGP